MSKRKLPFHPRYMRLVVRPIRNFFLLLGFIAAVVWSRDYWLPYMGKLLTVEETAPPGASALVILMGGIEVRPQYAAELYERRVAPKIIFSETTENILTKEGIQPSETELTTRLLVKLGVPKSDMIILRGKKISSTIEEAATIREEIIKTGVLGDHPRLILITSWPHTQRARWIFNKTLEPEHLSVDVAPVWDIGFSPTDWWHKEEGLLFVFEEYVKWGRYLWKYSLKKEPLS